jgi:hypothetical protein
MGEANPYRSVREGKQSCSSPEKAGNVAGSKQVPDVSKSLLLSMYVDEDDQHFRLAQAAV